MRRGGRPFAAAVLISMLLVQSTGAADLAFLSAVRPPAALSVPPSRAAFPLTPPSGPRAALPDAGLWGALRDLLAPAVYAADDWLAQPLDLPDLAALLPEPAPREAAYPVRAPAAPAPELPETSLVPTPGRPLDGTEPLPDRMLIGHRGFDMVLFGQDAREWQGALPPTHQVIAPVLEGPWRESHGLRYRINYLRPEGTFTLREGRIDIVEGSRSASFIRQVPLGPEYLRTYALYHEGDVVDYEIEVVNKTGRDLGRVLAFTNQEGFNHTGRIGKLLGRVQLATADSLPAGRRLVLSGQLRLSGFSAAGSNFEQTHLTVEADGKAGRTRLVDDPQAGILDPPRSR